MNRKDFRQLITRGPVLLGGAITTGNNERECAEKWVLNHFEDVASALSAFKDAGSTIICCPTSGANRYRLDAFGFASQTVAINREIMSRSRSLLGNCIIFGTCSTTGKKPEPVGELDFEDAVRCFSQQAMGLMEGGAEGFIIENMTDIQEARAALIALRELGDRPVVVHMGLEPDGRTAGGTDPLSALVTLQSLGADAVGFSVAGSGTGTGKPIGEIIAGLKPFATVPLCAFLPAANTNPEQYGAAGPSLIRAGANGIGGGQGVTAVHLAAIGKKIQGLTPLAPAVKGLSALSSATRTVLLGSNHPFAVVGERINPTGKKQLQESLREGSLDLVRQFAKEQQQCGATILDVNMGLSGIDEMGMMLKAVHLLPGLTPLPLCIDTTRPEVMEAALRRYPGRALVNSVSGERERLERTLPAAARYGAMFIVLPLTDAGIPSTAKERIAVLDTIISAAASYNCTIADIAVDGLVMTISSDPGAARVTLDLIEYCSRTLRANTIVGLSNVSFGMPERQWINGAFLGMAMGRGLTMAISNPSSAGIMATVQACNALRGHDTAMLMQQGAFKEKRS